ncbi:MAG: MotA/TolQ/ExbB proton channel family protein [Myxococcota bacterium]
MLIESLANALETLGAEWVLWLLLGLSVLSVAVMVERAVFLRRNRVRMDRLTAALLAALREGGEPAARRLVSDTPGMAGGVLRAAIDAWHDGVEAVEEVMYAAIARERVRYDRYVSILGTVATNAPFIGLLGTVIGVLNAFGQLRSALEGASRTNLVMGSISEALVATAVGLGVAIPAAIAFNVFKRRTKVIATEAESTARLVLAHLKTDGPAATRREA